MHVPTSASLNIQKVNKNTPPPLEMKITVLAGLLRSSHWYGEVLRTLTNRLRHPAKPYSDKDLEVLLLLTLALERAGIGR